MIGQVGFLLVNPPLQLVVGVGMFERQTACGLKDPGKTLCVQLPETRCPMRLLLLLPVCLAACLTPKTETCPQPGSSRCHESVAELCAPNGHWVLVMDCAALDPKGEWICSQTTDGHTCVKGATP